MKSQDSEDLERLFHAASALTTAERAEFLKSANPELAGAVRAMLEGAQDPSWKESALEIEARATAFDSRAPLPGEWLGPYRIVRRIGCGGMSLVCEAVRDDAEFQKRAAIKFVRQGIDDAAGIEQFRIERQILAQLEHPNIARLLDGGTTADGVPYLVMEFVDGLPLDRFVARHVLSRAQRIRLFLPICDAVQYAHRNLVVHRDLKPANILVTPDGVPKLLDFGIAKLLTGAPRGQTVTAFTPEFASPEQVLAQSVTTATDVYSLGVLLFQLLAGRLPYEVSSPGELVRAVCESDPVWPPRSIIDRDLKSILELCLRKEPEKRYSSVEPFSADLRRYLEGRPVEARSGETLYRAAKFGKRHVIPLAAAATVCLLLAAGTVFTTIQSRRVEKRFTEVRTLAHAVLFDFYDSIKDLPGTLPTRRLLASDAQRYLDGLARDAGPERAVVLDLAESYRRLGDVRGGPYQANLGDSAGAADNYRKAGALLGQALSRAPGAPELEMESAKVDISLGRLLSRQDSFGEAVPLLQHAIVRLETLLARFPKQNLYRETLAQAYQYLGEALGASALWHHSTTAADALAASQKALTVFQSSGPRADEDWQANLSAKYFAVGYRLEQVAGETGNGEYFRLALESHLQGYAIARALDRNYPGRHRRRVADALLTVAWARWRCCRELEQVLAEAYEALAIFEQLAAAEPSNAEIRRDVANAFRNLGTILGESGSKAEAIAADRRAVAIHEELYRMDPTSYENRSKLALARSQLAALQ